MGWLSRLFGKDEEQKAQQAQVTRSQVQVQERPQQAAPQAVAPERVGLDGQYDQSGLAKRVALKFTRTCSWQARASKCEPRTAAANTSWRFANTPHSAGTSSGSAP